VLQELQAVDSDDVCGQKQQRHSNSRRVIVSDDDSDGEANAENVVDKCNGDTSSADPQCTGLSDVSCYIALSAALQS